MELKINIQPEIIDYRITGEPVWLDIFHESDLHAFKMGIQFTGDPEADEMKHLEEVISKR